MADPSTTEPPTVYSGFKSDEDRSGEAVSTVGTITEGTTARDLARGGTDRAREAMAGLETAQGATTVAGSTREAVAELNSVKNPTEISDPDRVSRVDVV